MNPLQCLPSDGGIPEQVEEAANSHPLFASVDLSVTARMRDIRRNGRVA